jgi:hypothetical protein
VRLGLALCVSLLLATPRAVKAAEGAPFTRVALLLPGCELPGMSAAELRDAVALELQAAGLSLAPRGELAPTTDVLVRVDATCPGGDEITLIAELGEQRQRRRVELAELDRTQHARALSLSLAELLAAFSATQRPPSAAPDAGVLQPPPSSEPAAAAAPPEHQEPISQPPPPIPITKPPNTAHAPPLAVTEDLRGSSNQKAWQAGLAPQLRVFSGTWLWGGRARFHHEPWTVSADLLVARSRATAGQVATWVMQVDGGYDARLWGSTEGWLLEAGPRVGVGIAILHAEPDGMARAADALDAYFDAAVTARISFKLGQAVRSGLGAEVGYARGPVGYADGAEVARTAGPFASLLVDATLE